METVKSISAHPIDLDDGRQLGPGETAQDVSLHNAHNKALLDDGHIAVVGAAETEETVNMAVAPSDEERPANTKAEGGKK